MHDIDNENLLVQILEQDSTLVVVTDQAAVMKCTRCGKFKDAISFVPQELPAHLAPEGYVKCRCNVPTLNVSLV